MTYDPWGSPLAETYTDINLSGLENLSNFTGYTWDETLGLYFAQNRFYDAALHRFMQEDIIKDGANWYNYCRNNPLMFVDMLGLKAVMDIPSDMVMSSNGNGINQESNVVSPLNSANKQQSTSSSEDDKKSEPSISPSFKDRTRKMARRIIANDIFVHITQNSYFSEFFYLAGFVRDSESEGVYHTRQDALQRFAGYNKIYDVVFDYATSMQSENYTFVSNQQKYVLWVWKGDYLNLGAGAEMGIYEASFIPGHYRVNTSLAMPMTLELSFKNGEKVFNYEPSEKQWWITGFNPFYQDVLACELTAIPLTFRAI